MPKYEITALFTGSKYLGEFEADTEDEAISKALASNKNHASLCHQCSDEFELDDNCAHEAIANKID